MGKVNQISSVVCRLFFLGALFLVLCALSEKFAIYFGFSLINGYPPSRLLALAALALFFVITLLLRDIKKAIYISSANEISPQEESGLKIANINEKSADLR